MERSREPHQDRAIVFDLGEVLATPIGLFDRLAEELGCDAAAVSTAYWSHRDAHDRGMSSSEYWGLVVADLGVRDGGSLTERLMAIDSTVWSSIRPDAVELLRDLHQQRIRTSLLSNAPVALGLTARLAPWHVYIDQWFFSGDLGIAKPDPEVFAVVTTRLACNPDQIIFFDDREENVRAASVAGWDAYHWTSPATPRDALVELGLL